MSTSKSIERDLKTLRASKLMSTFPKYNMMIIQLEKFYNEEAKIIEKNERKDLDLRPFLYDEDDTYERPFYDILLKLLYDIVSFQSYKKQQEDVNKVYEWFLTHRRLISQDINNCDTSSSDIEVTRENISTPKLLLRPATADSSCNRVSRHVTCSRDLRSSMTHYEEIKNRNRKKYSPLDSVSIALKVIPLNQHKNKLNNKTHSKLERNTSYFPTRPQRKCSLPADFILKPCKQTSSPPASSKTSNFSISPKISPVQGKSTSQSPLVPRRIAFNIQSSALSNKLFQCESDNPLQVKNIERSSTSFKANTNNGEEDANTTKEVEGIFKTSMVDKEAKLLENQMKHLQNRKRNKELELMEHFKSDTENLLLDEITLQSLLLRDYEQFIKNERERNAKEFDSLSSTPSTLPKVELYDVGKQRPVSAVELRNIQDNNVCLESIIDLVHPVSEQMKYTREMKSNGMSIWDMESTMSDTIHSCQRNHSAASRLSFFDGLDRRSWP
ncbi:uncharacterized protein LOC124446038 [Xenia sp. Carnegie-2017]|uniref:uncharacterized protein LOC124446038 n=1 Tax=Xenia sp. Carnegie-2017 TaxID=2897299 RepID=UPI001F04122F|nr:uncharacterized protein LOC124446038 [Xenia sp. Carnegie-2017]